MSQRLDSAETNAADKRPGGGAWRPLLAGQARAEALRAVEDIAAALQPAAEAWSARHDHPAGIDQASLACGRAGAALFYACRAAALPDADETPVVELLDGAMEQMAERAMDSSLFCGFTGVAWVLDHARRLSGATDDEAGEPDTREDEARKDETGENVTGGDETGGDEDPCSDIDAALLEHVSRRRPDAEWDLIDGLIGNGVYGLDRMPRPAARRIAEEVVARLGELAVPQSVGLSWPTPTRRHEEDPRTAVAAHSFNLGMAHGVPCVIAYLGAACAAGAARAEATRLLDGAVAWLLDQRLPEHEISRFPHFRGPGVDESPARCAWCFGDPGVAAAMFIAADATGRDDWRREALGLARHAAARRADRPDVRDAGLCHGAGGVAHIFNRLYQATGDSVLREAAEYWINWALALRSADGGVGGFRSWSLERNPDGEWVDDPRFLTGAAGTGLALLAAATERPPEWDRCMLLS